MNGERRISCVCNEVTLHVRGDPIVSAECYCTSCRRAAEFLQRLPSAPRLQESTGATRMKLYRKDRVTCPKGGHLLREYRLAPDSQTRRVVAVCCNSPMFLDFIPGHWLSPFSKRCPAGEQDTIDMRTMLGDCPSPINFSDEIPSHKSHSLLFFAKLISAWAAMGFRRPAFDYGYQKLEMWGIQRN